MPTKPTGTLSINTGHSLANGLIGCYLFNEGSGSTIANLVASGGLPNGTLVGSASRATGSMGSAILLNAAGDCIQINSPGLSGNALTFVAAVTGAPNAQWAGIVHGPCTDGKVAGLWFNGTANNVGYVWNSDAFGTWGWNSGVTGTQNAETFLALSISPTQAIVKSDAATATNAIAHTAQTFNTLRFGLDGTSSARTFLGRFHYVYIYNRALSAAEMESLRLNPFVFIQSAGNLFPDTTQINVVEIEPTFQPGNANLLPDTETVSVVAIDPVLVRPATGLTLLPDTEAVSVVAIEPTFVNTAQPLIPARNEIYNLQHDAVIELFVLDLNPIGFNQIYRFCNYSNGSTNVVWQGQTYTAIALETDGWEYNGRGQLPTPKLRIGNVFSVITSLLLQYDDLVGARLTRKRTLARFLDGNPTADPNQFFEDDIYFIDRKETENRLVVEFELASSLDMQGVLLPKRAIVANTCPWLYKGAECGYTGSLPTCDKTLGGSNGCETHFGQYNPLPFGGFPGASVGSS